LSTVPPGHHGTLMTVEQVMCTVLLSDWWGLAAEPAGDWITMTAICMAESSGYCAAVSPVASDGTQGFGVAQIESSHTEFGTFDATGSNGWQDPIKNNTMGHKVYTQAGGKFEPWVTYQTGAYKLYMAAAQGAAGSILSTVNGVDQDQRTAFLTAQLSGVPEVSTGEISNLNKQSEPQITKDINGAVGAVTSTADFLGKLDNTKLWISVGYIVAGAVILLLVIVKMASGNPTIKNAAKAAVLL
jgi:hypothetical protein